MAEVRLAFEPQPDRTSPTASPPRRRRMTTQEMIGKGKALETAVGQIEKQFGKGSIVKLGAREVQDVPVISTTALSLDAALGIGGIPRGRVTEIYGPES